MSNRYQIIRSWADVGSCANEIRGLEGENTEQKMQTDKGAEV